MPFTPDPNELDPKIFETEHARRFNSLIGTSAVIRAKQDDFCQAYERHNNPEAEAGRRREIEGSAPFKALTDMLGENFALEIIEISEVAEADDDVLNPEDYQLALTERDLHSRLLVAYITGYQQHLAAGMVKAFGEQDVTDEITVEAWEATWKRLKSALPTSASTALAETADFFDALVRLKFAASYDPRGTTRGHQVQQDPAARTFYEIMADHLPRAIMHSGEDGWTGF